MTMQIRSAVCRPPQLPGPLGGLGPGLAVSFLTWSGLVPGPWVGEGGVGTKPPALPSLPIILACPGTCQIVPGVGALALPSP